MYYWLIKDYDRAIDELNDARRCFEHEEHQGMVVETDIKLAEICIEQDRLDEAKQVLDQARVIARQLACRTRVERVESALKKVTSE